MTDARRDGLLILVEGGFPHPPITDEAKAKARAELKCRRNGIIVLGGLPKSGDQ
jgi:hypothetical protein